jgi:hypothetical protein
MDPLTSARRQAGLEIQTLAREFAASDEAAFRRTRIGCWILVAVVSVIVLVLLIAGADWRYLAGFWVAIVGLAWGGYALSTYRQRQQTGRLEALATRWLTETPPPSAG